MKIRLSVTIPEEVIEKIKTMADQEKRNLSNMVSVILEEAADKNKKTA